MIAKLVLAALAGFASMGITAAPASADEYDFLDAVDAKGVYYDNTSDMIEAGKLVCHGMRAHMYGPVISAQLESYGDWTSQEKSIIFMAAANTMCPDVWPWIHSLNSPPSPQTPMPSPCVPGTAPEICAEGVY